jgi:uncharacterized protein YegP (UPF0339 family)
MVITDCSTLAAREPVPSFRCVGRGQLSGKYRFRLKAGNGEIIAVSEAYETKASAQNGVASVQKNAADATVVT